jgi:hypothetical protein
MDRGEIRVAELQHGGRQRELAPVGTDVAQVLEGEQEPAGGPPGQVGALGDLGERHARVPGREALDHVQRPLDGLDELGRPLALSHAGLPEGGRIRDRRPGQNQPG